MPFVDKCIQDLVAKSIAAEHTECKHSGVTRAQTEHTYYLICTKSGERISLEDCRRCKEFELFNGGV